MSKETKITFPVAAKLDKHGSNIHAFGKAMSAYLVYCKAAVIENKNVQEMKKGMYIKIQKDLSFTQSMAVYSLLTPELHSTVFQKLEKQNFGYNCALIWDWLFNEYNGKDKNKRVTGLAQLVSYQFNSKDVEESCINIQNTSEFIRDANGSDNLDIESTCRDILTQTLPNNFECQ
jgi:hypothetical protein